jgi:NHLM bacteriocin system ABC transporter ATP-binding protein
MIQNLTKIENIPGEKYRFNGNEPILLDDPRAIWVVQSGSLALFAINVKSGTPEGTRRFLFTVKAGEAMFSTPHDTHEEGIRQILAVSLEESELIRVSKTDFETSLATQKRTVINLVESWIHQLGKVLEGIRTERPSVPDTAIQYFSLALGEIFQSYPHTICWIRMQVGRVRWMGIPQLGLEPGDEIMPLGANMWLIAEEIVEFERLHTDTIDDADILLAGVNQVQNYFLRCIDLLEAAENQQERQRFQERDRLNRQMMTETLGELVEVVRSQPMPVTPDSTAEVTDNYEAVLVAAGAVGRMLGIKIRPPAKSEDMRRVQDPLDAIARASQMRMRRIQLTDDWWQKDCGPMLGYTAEDDRPVALLPTSSSSYEMFDPILRKRLKLTAKRARTLSKCAYVFYRPLPDKENLTTFDLLQFAVRGHYREILVVLATGMIVTLLGMLTPQATAILIDDAIPSTNRDLLIQIAGVLIAATFGSTLFQLAQGLAVMRLETYADASTQAAVWDRLLKLKASFFRKYAIGDLQSRVQSISQIRQLLGTTVIKSIFSSVFSLLNLGLLFYYSPTLAFVALLVAFINIAVTVVSGIITLKKVRPQLELQGQIFGVMVQLINGVTKLRVAGAEARAFAYWGKQYTQQLKLTLSTQGVEDIVTVINKILPSLTTAALFWFATTSIQEAATTGGKGFTTGTFLAFNAAFGIFIGGATSLSTTVIDVLQIVPLWQRAQPILKAEPEVDSNKADPGRLTGRLNVEHAIFRYRDDGPLTLDDVSVYANPGEFIAFVGTSGSGKSTLFRLLLGFDIPESGSIYYDGQDLAGLDINAVRRQLGVVMQNSRLTSASIYENIACGALVSMEECWEASKMAGFAEDIQSMPMQMHTVISEGGGNISGGQRQRLLIARALVLKPRILLFDEATSALDNRTQAIVSESLERLQVTRIAIAHRLSTIRKADRIYVFENGRITQHGSFEELAQQKGLFAQLMARQSL